MVLQFRLKVYVQMLVTMQGHVFVVDLNVLPLEDYELVLGT